MGCICRVRSTLTCCILALLYVGLNSTNANVTTAVSTQVPCENASFSQPLLRPDDILCHESDLNKVSMWTNRAICNVGSYHEYQPWISVCVFSVDTCIVNLKKHYDCVVTGNFGPVNCTEKNSGRSFNSDCSFTFLYCTGTTLEQYTVDNCENTVFDNLYKGGKCGRLGNSPNQNIYSLTRFLYDHIVAGGEQYDELRELVVQYPIYCYSWRIALGCGLTFVLICLSCLVLRARKVLKKDLLVASDDERIRDLTKLLHDVPESIEYCDHDYTEQFICITDMGDVRVRDRPRHAIHWDETVELASPCEQLASDVFQEPRKSSIFHDPLDSATFLFTPSDAGSSFSDAVTSPKSSVSSHPPQTLLNNGAINAPDNFYVGRNRGGVAFENRLYTKERNGGLPCCNEPHTNGVVYLNEPNSAPHLQNLSYLPEPKCGSPNSAFTETPMALYDTMTSSFDDVSPTLNYSVVRFFPENDSDCDAENVDIPTDKDGYIPKA
uniref:uncharacterized protein LOC108949302 isoform X2 n=1 Tax=Ciona intestinalis TaxID=7719 RepID=UPI00089DCC02|nr:uncharacterized protein LOC108949302 isoform X2 [Ciona intestinalis]|eukprot:XP_018666649.1 uncharacterized protein LOC108949302 isoform X2 [Ciona intestinalis]